MSHMKKRKYHNTTKKNKTPARNYQKAFALSTFIASTLKDYDTSKDREILSIYNQSKQVMQSYHPISGVDHFNELTDKLGNIWVYLLTRNESNSIKEDDVPALIEAMCMIIAPLEFENMFGIKPYIRDRHIYYTAYPLIVSNVMELDKELNKLLGTKPYSIVKPKKEVVKAKKERDKSKKKVKEKIVNANKLKKSTARKSKDKNMTTLRDMIAKSKIKAEEASESGSCAYCGVTTEAWVFEAKDFVCSECIEHHGIEELIKDSCKEIV